MHFSLSVSAWVGSTAMSGCLFLYPFTLRIRRKFGIRTSVLIAGALMLPLFLASPMVPSMDFLFLTFSVPFAIAASLVGCATLTTILDYFDKFQGVAFGVRLSASSLGAIMFSYLIPILLEEIGWQRTFWILTGICFVTMCFALAYNDTKCPCDHPANNNNNEEMVQKIDERKIYSRLLKNKEYLVYLIANTVFSSVVFMPPVFMVSYSLLTKVCLFCFVHFPSLSLLHLPFRSLSSFPPSVPIPFSSPSIPVPSRFFPFCFLPFSSFSVPFLYPTFRSIPSLFRLLSFPPVVPLQVCHSDPFRFRPSVAPRSVPFGPRSGPFRSLPFPTFRSLPSLFRLLSFPHVTCHSVPFPSPFRLFSSSLPSVPYRFVLFPFLYPSLISPPL